MPFHLVRAHDGKDLWYVVNSDTGERKNPHKPEPREAALAFMRALYAHIPDAKKSQDGR